MLQGNFTPPPPSYSPGGGEISLQHIKIKNYIIICISHEDIITDLIKMDDNIFISSSFDKIIKIWNY